MTVGHDRERVGQRHRPQEVRRLVQANHAGTEDNALRIWALLSLELWQRTYIDRHTSVGQA